MVLDISRTSVTAGTNTASPAPTDITSCRVVAALWTMRRIAAVMTRAVIGATNDSYEFSFNPLTETQHWEP